MKHILLFCLSMVIYTASTQAAGYYEFSPLLRDAYKKAISLRFEEAKALTTTVKEQEPNNLLVHYVENYMDFLKIYIDEDLAEFEQLERNKDSRLKQLKSGDENSPYYLYTQAEVRLQWAVARAKFGEYRTAMFEVRKAFLMLEKNNKRFPDFVANKKSLGILHSVVGAVPPNYRWLVKLAGMNGTIEQGRAEIKEVVEYAQQNPGFIFEEETIIMYALMVLHIGNESSEAWEIIRSSQLDPSQNPLICFAQASVAQHTGRSRETIKILAKRPKGKQYHPFYFLDYMMGLAKLSRQEKDAGYYLNRYVMNFTGRNYIKECYQRLAWFELLNGNINGYHKNMKRVLQRGKTDVDGDKNALKAAQSGKIPNTTLLKARLLFDGGQLEEAGQLLAQHTEADFTKLSEKIEFQYRKGRVAQGLGQYSRAIQAYDTTIENGKYQPEYFACRAALEAGVIKENANEIDAAEKYYRTCLDISPSEYKNSLHGKAKAGLNRIGR